MLNFDDDDLFLVESAGAMVEAMGSLVVDLKKEMVDDALAERTEKISGKIDEIVVAMTTGSDDGEEFDDLFEELEKEGCGEKMGRVREVIRREMVSKA